MLSLKRDFTRFLDMKDFPQQVVVHIDSEELICSGILLAQQSDLIEKLITQNEGVLKLDKINKIGSSEQVKDCINYMYGAKLEFSLENIAPTIKFASLYGVDELFNRCCQWMEKNVSPRNMLSFYEIPLAFESKKQKTRVKSIVEKFIGENGDVCGSELYELLAHGNVVDSELFILVISCSPCNGADLLRTWTSKSLENRYKILETAENIDFVDLFPVQEDFTAFVTQLSEGSDSVESMKQVLQLQQSYFVNSAMKQSKKMDETSKHNQQGSPKSNKKANPSSEDSEFKPYNETVPNSQPNKPKAQQQQHQKTANKPNPNKPNPNKPNQNRSNQNKPNKATASQADKPQHDKTLFVGNLPPDVTSEDVITPLNFAGKIKNVDLVPNKNIAFVQFQSENSLKVILDASKNGVQFTVKGKQVAVQKYVKTAKPSKHSSVV